jgi:hypothetical protein
MRGACFGGFVEVESGIGFGSTVSCDLVGPLWASLP